MKGTEGQLAMLAAGELTVAERGVCVGGSATARVTWGFPVNKPVLQERLQHIHTTAETSKISDSLQQESVCVHG